MYICVRSIYLASVSTIVLLEFGSVGFFFNLFYVFQVNWQMDVINCLLNHGADVNKLNDEGCSVLSAGAIFFYPLDGFRYNIAERYLERPAVYEEKDRKPSTSKSQQKGIMRFN